MASLAGPAVQPHGYPVRSTASTICRTCSTTPASDSGAAAYRGFLFSDVRGFTAFAERHGNTAAAAMVGRFLEIARAAIARHEGAEIQTQGDAIHAVFPSASSAVMCGLEIVDVAARLNAEEPGRPLGLGVGVHAGEAVETAEGYIGTAVNLAARVCAEARPGEVLVTSTVKGITQASIPVGFIARGRRRLKGIREPVEVYAVTRDMTARSRREVPRSVVVGAAGVAMAGLVAIAVLAGSQLPKKPGASPPATAAPAAQPLVIGPLPIGTYTSRAFQPPFTFDIVDQDWTATRDRAGILGLIRDAAPRGSVYFLRVQEVIANPCVDGGEGAQTGPGAADLLTELEALEHLSLWIASPRGSVASRASRWTSPSRMASLRRVGAWSAARRRSSMPARRSGKTSPGERFRLISVGAGDEAVTIVSSTDWTETPSVQELEGLLELGQRVLDSVEF